MVKNKRLEAIVSLIDPIDTLLDIGVDHGYTILMAFKADKIKKAIASDINEKPLMQAKKNLEGYPVTFVKSDGFKMVETDYDLATINGMGAYLICDILKNQKSLKPLILQPNDKEHIVREYLSKNGYIITDEKVIFDKFYYLVIKALPGEMKLSESEFFTGKHITSMHQKYYRYKTDVLEKLLDQVDEKRFKEIAKELSFYQNVLKK